MVRKLKEQQSQLEKQRKALQLLEQQIAGAQLQI